MKKLELKHLSSYLPYGLKIKTTYGWDTMKTLNDWSINGDCEVAYCYETEDTTDFKPILRPLSDLTKEIEVNGEKFIPIEEFGDFNGFYSTGLGDRIYFDELTFENAITLHEWHFDIYGLIEAGLAVDINTLKEKEL